MTIATHSAGRRLALALACFTSSALLVNALFAQTPQKSPPPVESAANELAVVPLKNAAAAEVAQALSGVFGGREPRITIGIDHRSNAVIIAAPAGKLSEVKDIIVKLDVPVATKPAGAEVRVFTLRNLNPDKSVEAALKLVLGAHGLAANNLAIDAMRNQVVVAADKQALDAVQAMLARLEDQSPRRPSTTDLQLRVVWLVKSPAGEEYPSPPDDLKDVLPALAKVGLEKPRVAAQTLITVAPNTPFRA